jgi:hypothetical protein
VEEDMDENNNKENDFEFAKPSMPIYRSASGTGKRRPISAPAELMVICQVKPASYQRDKQKKKCK